MTHRTLSDWLVDIVAAILVRWRKFKALVTSDQFIDNYVVEGIAMLIILAAAASAAGVLTAIYFLVRYFVS